VKGQCGADQGPLYRVYNSRFVQIDFNHRYTTDTTLYAQMRAQGWVGEGIVFCAPAG
jgi:hypothetical protein